MQGSVFAILDAVANGMDLIDSPLASAATTSYVALTFPLPSELLTSFSLALKNPDA